MEIIFLIMLLMPIGLAIRVILWGLGIKVPSAAEQKAAQAKEKEDARLKKVAQAKAAYDAIPFMEKYAKKEPEPTALPALQNESVKAYQVVLFLITALTLYGGYQNMINPPQGTSSSDTYPLMIILIIAIVFEIKAWFMPKKKPQRAMK